MANATSRLCVVGLVLVAAGSGFGAETKLAVVIFDYAGTSGGTLKAAADTAREAFRTAGVETDWSVCRVPNEHCVLSPVRTMQVSATEGGGRATLARSNGLCGDVPAICHFLCVLPARGSAGQERQVVGLLGSGLRDGA